MYTVFAFILFYFPKNCEIKDTWYVSYFVAWPELQLKDQLLCCGVVLWSYFKVVTLVKKSDQAHS